jgi:hypothetical protein
VRGIRIFLAGDGVFEARVFTLALEFAFAAGFGAGPLFAGAFLADAFLTGKFLLLAAGLGFVVGFLVVFVAIFQLNYLVEAPIGYGSIIAQRKNWKLSSRLCGSTEYRAILSTSGGNLLVNMRYNKLSIKIIAALFGSYSGYWQMERKAKPLV